ncbi:hypothetical protein JFU37_23225 [Pseudomonas sp. TH41]|uniref:hypothetical protein n=1 Tax=Pseudomonas sp. TH41 TaxID=2796405 RepID=UPI0019142C6F|nr:hypothetical protein [Pseudomonas sp. TH41]MBK5355401.1 hypothetical protein [Pseudomonas sp. TH41]
MTRWRRLWLSVKVLAAVAACLTVAVQAFQYMLESPDAVQIHPLSIVGVGLIFGFVTFGVLSLIEWVVRRFVALFAPVTPQPQAEIESDVELTPEQPLTLASDDSTQQKNQ